jgi:hypothetical protein
MKFVVNNHVRELLGMLNIECERFDELTGRLAERGTEHCVAVELGSDRVSCERRMCSIAYQINKRSIGLVPNGTGQWVKPSKSNS